MAKFAITPHFRLHEWVAEEKGYFRQQGLDYEFRGVFEIVYDVTEPVLRPVRGILPPIRMGAMGLDLSPVIVFIALGILQGAICSLGF